MNEFVPLTDGTAANHEKVNRLQVGDLVTMTVVDVFETDSQGKLLSYCPTFDNRAIVKTHRTAETVRKSSSKLLTMLGQARDSQLTKLVVAKTAQMAQRVKDTVDEAVNNYGSPKRQEGMDSDLHLAEESTAVTDLRRQRSATHSSYLADDDTELHEV